VPLTVKPKDGKEVFEMTTVTLSKNDVAMIRAAAAGLSGPEVEQFVEKVRNELEALNVTPTRNHVRAACTAVLGRGK
jgi:hypothetical protein